MTSKINIQLININYDMLSVYRVWWWCCVERVECFCSNCWCCNQSINQFI